MSTVKFSVATPAFMVAIDLLEAGVRVQLDQKWVGRVQLPAGTDHTADLYLHGRIGERGDILIEKETAAGTEFLAGERGLEITSDSGNHFKIRFSVPDEECDRAD